MWTKRVLLLVAVLAVTSSTLLGQEVEGTRPLLAPGPSDLPAILPADAQLLRDAAAIERFLDTVDGVPPDWAAVWEAHGAGHDERLFSLNRQRDRLREGRTALAQRVTVFWSGELSAYDPRRGGFRVAIGPKIVPTRWGLVRFKPEGLPAELVAVPSPALREALRGRLAKGERVEIDLAMTGRLVPEESIIYDFAHEEPGGGMVMPVVRVERIDYLLLR